ncbi:unnamed protein product, partial [Musa hybrid cultivar]
MLGITGVNAKPTQCSRTSIQRQKPQLGNWKQPAKYKAGTERDSAFYCTSLFIQGQRGWSRATDAMRCDGKLC